MTVEITLTTIQVDATTFDLYSNVDGYSVAFETGILAAQLQSGYTSVLVPGGTTSIRVQNVSSACTNYIDLILVTTTTTTSSTTTTTTTGATVNCYATTNSGGVGVTEFVIPLNSFGGSLIMDFNAQGVPDKLEILHNSTRVATSGMTVANAGPFDTLYGDPLVPTSAQVAATDQFIGSSKGVINNRNAEFLADTGITGITANRQQLIWWIYSPADYSINTNAVVRVTGPTGTAWNLDRQCIPEYVTLLADIPNVNEGGIVNFTVTSNNVIDSTTVGYTITGVQSEDIVGGLLTGTFTIVSDTANVAITLVEDFVTEGPETLTLTLDATDSASTSTGSLFDDVIVNDTSTSTTTTTTTLAPVPAYLSITADAANVDEGSTVNFNIVTENISLATTVGYTISGTGITSGDVFGGSLTGNATITANAGVISITLDPDFLTEGPETMFVTLNATDSNGVSTGSISDSVIINDTSINTTTTTTTAAFAGELVDGGISSTTHATDACAEILDSICSVFTNTEGTLTVGDQVYSDLGGTIPFIGNGQYYHISLSITINEFSAKINASGIVESPISICAP